MTLCDGGIIIKTVEFPDLNLFFQFDGTAFAIGTFEIRWYAVWIATGLVLAVMFALWQGKRYDIARDDILDVTLYGAIVAILCARIYFVLFNLDYYLANPLQILNTRGGGIAIYGAIIGAALTVVWYCKRKKMSILNFYDLGCMGMLIGQIIGRWGNFVNAEAYGSETTLPWRMVILDAYTGQYIGVHPTFLYESLWNLATLIILFAYSKSRKFYGEIFLWYVVSYGIGRAWIEQLRVDSLPYNGSYKVSQIVGLATAIIAVGFLVYAYRRVWEGTLRLPHGAYERMHGLPIPAMATGVSDTTDLDSVREAEAQDTSEIHNIGDTGDTP